MQSTLSIKRAVFASALLLAHTVGSTVATAALPPKYTKGSSAKLQIDGKEHTYKVTLKSEYQPLGETRKRREVNDITVVVPATQPGTGPTNSHIDLLQYDDELILSTTRRSSDLCFEISTDSMDYVAKKEKGTRHVVTIVTVSFEPSPDEICAQRALEEGIPIPQREFVMTDECGFDPDLTCLLRNR